MYAYIKSTGVNVERFRLPIKFSVSRRKFQEVANTWNFEIEEAEVAEVTGKQYQVPGSKGAIYTVTDDHGSWSCTCPASKWQKGECKHIKQLKG